MIRIYPRLHAVKVAVADDKGQIFRPKGILCYSCTLNTGDTARRKEVPPFK